MERLSRIQTKTPLLSISQNNAPMVNADTCVPIFVLLEQSAMTDSELIMNEPNKLYAVINPNEVDDLGVPYAAYLAKRYGEGKYGFMESDMRVVLFYDEGHRDEFMKRYGGLKGTARMTNRLPNSKLIGAC